MQEDLYQYLACDYYATGEGRTVSLLITRAYPRTDDYEDVMMSNLKPGHTAKVRAAREFSEKFGGWYLHGAENLSRDEFLRKYGNHLPEYLPKMLAAEGDDRPGNLNFSTQIHMNFS
jgi:hypothetical protein